MTSDVGHGKGGRRDCLYGRPAAHFHKEYQ
jgi:hypothetical protein